MRTRNVVVKATPRDPGVWIHALDNEVQKRVRDMLAMRYLWHDVGSLTRLLIGGLGMGGLGRVSTMAHRSPGTEEDIVLTIPGPGLAHGQVRIGKKRWSFPRFIGEKE